MFELSAIALCLIINAILAGSETAFIATDKHTLLKNARQGSGKAKLLLKLKENPERTLSTIQIGITFVGAFAAAVGGAGAEESISPFLIEKLNLSETAAEIASIFLVIVPLTYVNVVLGELVPKILALRRPFFIASATLPWLIFITKSLRPIIGAFEWSTKKIIELFFKPHADLEEEAGTSSLEDFFSPLNKQYIMNMIKIERTTVKEIFVEWSDVVYVEFTDNIKDVERLLVSSGHTRVPIVKGGALFGILNSKEFFAFQKTNKKNWLSLSRQIVSFQETTLILTALRLLQEKRAHMGIVFNGLKKTGVVTMEAIFEEIIGDIYDEDDDGAIEKILSKTKW